MVGVAAVSGGREKGAVWLLQSRRVLEERAPGGIGQDVGRASRRPACGLAADHGIEECRVRRDERPEEQTVKESGGVSRIPVPGPKPLRRARSIPSFVFIPSSRSN